MSRFQGPTRSQAEGHRAVCIAHRDMIEDVGLGENLLPARGGCGVGDDWKPHKNLVESKLDHAVAVTIGNERQAYPQIGDLLPLQLL